MSASARCWSVVRASSGGLVTSSASTAWASNEPASGSSIPATLCIPAKVSRTENHRAS
jgi:hypothetical protein